MKDIDKAKTIARKVKCQFPESPEGRLMFSIFECAMLDAYRPINEKETPQAQAENEMIRRSGLKYLSEDMPHCELAGVSSEWIRRLIHESGLPVNPKDCW